MHWLLGSGFVALVSIVGAAVDGVNAVQPALDEYAHIVNLEAVEGVEMTGHFNMQPNGMMVPRQSALVRVTYKNKHVREFVLAPGHPEGTPGRTTFLLKTEKTLIVQHRTPECDEEALGRLGPMQYLVPATDQYPGTGWSGVSLGGCAILTFVLNDPDKDAVYKCANEGKNARSPLSERPVVTVVPTPGDARER